ncbi:MAG: ribonuclease P protein component [Patescibacteria group bacterium]
MISRVHRFHGHGSLRFVYQHGQTVRGPMTALKYSLNKKRPSYRLAVVVSKKISKSAVKRNRIRRRLYEAFRAYEPLLSGPYDIVITVFSDSLATIPADQLQRLMRAQLRQGGLLKPTSDPPHGKIESSKEASDV